MKEKLEQELRALLIIAKKIVSKLLSDDSPTFENAELDELMQKIDKLERMIQNFN